LSGGEHYGTHANVPRAELSARDVFFHRAVIHRAVTRADWDCPLTKGHLLSRNAQRLPPWKVPAQDRADQKNFAWRFFEDNQLG